MLNNSDSISFNNFLYDTLVRSFDRHNWITEELTTLNSDIELGLFNLTKKQTEYFYDLYNSMKETLLRNVTISSELNNYKPDKLFYHRRFGWTLSNNSYLCIKNELKIFLGKISILDNTKIRMGKWTYISGHSTIKGGGNLIIGSFSPIAEGLKIFTSGDAHPMNYPSMIDIKGPRFSEDGFDLDIHYPKIDNINHDVIIGNDVWLGRNVSIKSNVKIGNGCVIGEGSLVKKDCEPYGVYAGYPAKLIRYRFDNETIQQLMKIRWWDWSMEKILKNRIFFSTELSTLKKPIKDLII
jgi:acetyltransferase-like isoleucine patch superfamily enzyme